MLVRVQATERNACSLTSIQSENKLYRIAIVTCCASAIRRRILLIILSFIAFGSRVFVFFSFRLMELVAQQMFLSCR